MRKLKTKKLKIQKFTIAASPQQFNIQHSTFNIPHCGIAATIQHSTFNIQNSIAFSPCSTRYWLQREKWWLPNHPPRFAERGDGCTDSSTR